MKNNRLFTAGVAAGMAAGAAAIVAHMKKRIDLTAAGKRAVKAVQLTMPVTEKYDNSAAPTPPMGWSSWNLFRNKIDEKLMLETANAMKASGLVDAGYVYLNLDDCWQSSMRDENGKLQGDLRSFPSGIKSLREQVNALGMKLGIYSSNGTHTCEDMPASLDHEAIDADTFAQWGIEYFKYDFCHNRPIPQRAPCIEKILLGRPGDADELELDAEDAVLHGTARVVEDEKLSTSKYIAGLSGNLGSAEFFVEVSQAGKYILTLCIRKKSNSYKYAEIIVNDKKKFKTIVPPTRAFSPDGRHQVEIELDEGANFIKILNPVASRRDSSAMQYTNMGKELLRATREYAEKTGEPVREICYEICEWGLSLPWQWGSQAGNVWRTTMDIKPFWASVLGIYEINVKLYNHSGKGSWNDPDMLEVGNGSLTAEENKTHFTLWCMMAAPLILGNDIRKFLNEDGSANLNDETLKIVGNRKLIAIDQDALGIQCRRFKTNGITDVLVKPLENGEVAVCLFNKSSQEQEMSVSLRSVACLSYVDMSISYAYECSELWDNTTEIIENNLSVSVPSHGVKIYRIKALSE